MGMLMPVPKEDQGLTYDKIEYKAPVSLCAESLSGNILSSSPSLGTVINLSERSFEG